MTIEQLFDKPIARNIKGVVKVQQHDDDTMYQELDEYVVTRELNKHFHEFFENYKEGITGYTDNMGVWISGFFGSGKSHFLKILSYLLENRKIKDKYAIDFFTNGKKVDDALLVSNIKLAGQTPTDVILFNIDSKSEADSKSDKDAIINVFVRVFNEMLGYCGSMPFVAEMEHKLYLDEKYDQFKNVYKKNTGKEWADTRDDFYYIQDDLIKALSESGVMSEASARNWCEKAADTYSMTIEKFADMVNKYCEKKGSNHHVVFLVDEIGQYIAENTGLMLNLQTVTEDLGTACRGKAWIIVTSQQDIDSLTSVKGNDFSKIQGRFHTRLSLSSANVDEVIRKRILEKTPEAKKELQVLYDSKEAIIKNLITFSDKAEKKLYEDRDDFAEVYPFIPYQFNLLGHVLTAIRTHGASGKHLADGERSMLALFQESAISYKTSAVGMLVPFCKFYDALHKFIDHTYADVILQAEDNKNLNEFDVSLLKLLFMIKYVKEVKSTQENLTTLMVSAIDEDRIELERKVTESLARLLEQTLIQKNGDEYMFLTNDEQDINKAIKQEIVETGELLVSAEQTLFNDVYKDRKYRYSNRYNFGFYVSVDEAGRSQTGTSTAPIGIHILTPYSSNNSADKAQQLSRENMELVILLPPESNFLEEIRQSMQIDKYLRKNDQELNGIYEGIKHAKQEELSNRKKNIITLLQKAVEDADLFIMGDPIATSSHAAADRINEGMNKLVQTVYNKLSYMTTEPTVQTIRAIFQCGNELSFESKGDSYANKNAVDEANRYIYNESLKVGRITEHSVIDTFTAVPYGFTELDIGWILGALFMQGKISLSINSRVLSALDTPADEITDYLTKLKEYGDKLVIEKKEKASEKTLKVVRDVLRDAFNVQDVTGEDESIAKSVKESCATELDEIKPLLDEYIREPRYPGKEVLTKEIDLLEGLLARSGVAQLFKFIEDNQNDILDASDDSLHVTEFFHGQQKECFKRALENVLLYTTNKNYIVNKELSEMVPNMESILKQTSPWSSIAALNSLNESFEKLYTRVLEEEKKPVKATIEQDHKAVEQILQNNKLPDSFSVSARFEELEQKLAGERDISRVKSLINESAAVKENVIANINAEIERASAQAGKAEAGTPVCRIKTVMLRSLVSSAPVTLASENDIDTYVDGIKNKLKQELAGSAQKSITVMN